MTYEKGSSISEGQIHVLLAEIYGILEEDYTVDQIVISNVKLLLDDAEVEINQDNVSIIDYYAENTHTLRISLFNEYGSDEEKGENAAVDAAALSCDNGKISISFDLTLAEE